MGKITYADKVALNEDPSIADINKCKADDMNEIKNVVNNLLPDISSQTAPQNPVLNELWLDTNDEEHLAEVDDEVSTTSTNAVQNQAITNYVNGLNTYSTTEQRVGTWIDGKPLYRKVYTGTLSSTHTTIETLANINNLNIVSINGWIKKSSTVQQQIGTYSNADNNSGVWVTNDGIQVNAASGWVNSGYIVILEYTKTTD